MTCRGGYRIDAFRMYQRRCPAILMGMGLLKSGATAQADALVGFNDEALGPIVDQAMGAKLANRKTLALRLPLPVEAAGAAGDVRFWSAAVQQVGQHGWSCVGWSVVAEPGGTVAYGLFVRT